MCRHLPCLPERFHSTSGTDSGTVITLAISKVAYRCIPWDPRYSSISDIQCIFHELVASWISIILSLSNISSEIWTKSRGIGSQRQLLPESGLWMTLTYLDIHRHHPARHLTSPEDPLPRLTTRNVQQNSMHLLQLGWVGLQLLTGFGVANVEWLLLTGFGLFGLERCITLSTCPPPSPYFFFPILNFHRLQINNYCMKSESSDSSNLFRLWKILTAYAKDAKNADMSANAYYSWLFPNSFHPSLDCCGSLVRGTTAVSNQAPGAGIITESALAMIDHEPNESSCDQAGGWWAQRSTLRINL